VARVHSPSFGPDMWNVLRVPDRTHIIIHVANWPANVQGCIGLGVGLFAKWNGVSESKRAVDDFYERTAELNKWKLIIREGV